LRCPPRIPTLVLALAIVATLGTSQKNVIMAISIAMIPLITRIIRGSVLVVCEETFVEAARALGARVPRIMLRHVLPNLVGPVVVVTIRRLIHRISTHHDDHLQHILKARRAIGSPRSESVRALAEMQAARAELVTSLLGLNDEDLTRDCSEGQELGNLQPRGEREPEYTIRRIAEHVVEMEEMRLGHIRRALDRGVSS